MKKRRWVRKKAGQFEVKGWNDLKMFLLNSRDASQKFLSINLVDLPANRKLPSIRHKKTHEWGYIVRGSMRVLLDGERISMKQGEYLYLPPNVWHSFEAGPKGVTAISIYQPRFQWHKPDVEAEHDAQ